MYPAPSGLPCTSATEPASEHANSSPTTLVHPSHGVPLPSRMVTRGQRGIVKPNSKYSPIEYALNDPTIPCVPMESKSYKIAFKHPG